MAPDSNSESGFPPGPCGSRMAGILLLGKVSTNSGESWSLLSKPTRCASYGRPISSRAIDTLTPLGVGREYSWMRSGCVAGHLRVTEKAESGFCQVMGHLEGWTGSPRNRWPLHRNVRRPAMLGTLNNGRSEEHTSELQSHLNLVCRLLLEKKK